MSIVKGRVVSRETGEGLQDLLVSVHDLESSNMPPEELLETARKTGAAFWHEIPGRRLGSIGLKRRWREGGTWSTD